jgi:hypothetical protein
MGFSSRVTNRRRYAYDQRTGLKVFGADRLQEDGERPGILTIDWDEQHPQRHIDVPRADRIHYVQKTSDPNAIPVILSIGRLREEGSGTNARILAPHIGLAPVIMTGLSTSIIASAAAPATIAATTVNGTGSVTII